MGPVSHHKICTASVVDPNPVLVRAPAVTFGARSIAVLSCHPHHRVSRIHLARMLSHVVGVAGNRLYVSVVAAVVIRVTIWPALILIDAISPDCEIRAASMINPDATVIRAPAVAFIASCIAVLRQQAHSASRIKRARMSSLIVGVAGNRRRIPVILPIAVVAIRILINSVLILVVPVFTNYEVGPASVVDPDAIFIRSPAVAFGAGGVAVLRCQAHSASYIHRAGMPPHIVGVAGNPGLAP
jgi:hypothetical protein